jgi:hypothetical protein
VVALGLGQRLENGGEGFKGGVCGERPIQHTVAKEVTVEVRGFPLGEAIAPLRADAYSSLDTRARRERVACSAG